MSVSAFAADTPPSQTTVGDLFDEAFDSFVGGVINPEPNPLDLEIILGDMLTEVAGDQSLGTFAGIKIKEFFGSYFDTSSKSKFFK